MRIRLLPSSTEFYDLFTRAGQNALEAARKAELRFREFPNPSVGQDDVKALEHVGDNITRDIITLLNTQYVTPFDREDIYELAGAVDDVVDGIEHACDMLGLYGVDSTSRRAIEQCRVLVLAADQLAQALALLKSRTGVEASLIELKRLEDEGDRVHRDAIASLFQDARIDPLIVIRWKDIHDVLEDAIDACERAGNVVGNIVVKNA